MGIRAGKGAGGEGRQEPGRSPHGMAAALVLGLSVAACTTSGQPGPTASTPRGPTVAFESIDGPPESVFRKLVQDLSDEAGARQLAVVSRTGPAQYRVRGYVAAQTQGKRSTIMYVWDVYDAQQRRTLRIVGEEPASAVGSGTWAVADDSVLRRIAHDGMDRLAAFLASPDAQPGAPAPDEPAAAQAVASNSDAFAPQSAGIYRISGDAAAAASAEAAGSARTEAATTPPPTRTAATGLPSQHSLAYLAPGR